MWCCSNSLSQLGRRESKKLRACRFHGLKRHQHPCRCPCTLELGKHFCFRVVLTLQPFGSACLWARSGLELDHQLSVGSEAPPSWSCTCSRFLQLGLSGMRLFLPARAPGSTGILSGPGKWGWCFSILLLQVTVKPLRRVLGIWRHNSSPGSFYFTTIWYLQSSLSWRAVWVTKILYCAHSYIQKAVL